MGNSILDSYQSGTVGGSDPYAQKYGKAITQTAIMGKLAGFAKRMTARKDISRTAKAEQTLAETKAGEQVNPVEKTIGDYMSKGAVIVEKESKDTFKIGDTILQIPTEVEGEFSEEEKEVARIFGTGNFELVEPGTLGALTIGDKALKLIPESQKGGSGKLAEGVLTMPKMQETARKWAQSDSPVPSGMDKMFDAKALEKRTETIQGRYELYLEYLQNTNEWKDPATDEIHKPKVKIGEEIKDDSLEKTAEETIKYIEEKLWK